MPEEPKPLTSEEVTQSRLYWESFRGHMFQSPFTERALRLHATLAAKEEEIERLREDLRLAENAIECHEEEEDLFRKRVAELEEEIERLANEIECVRIDRKLADEENTALRKRVADYRDHRSEGERWELERKIKDKRIAELEAEVRAFEDTLEHHKIPTPPEVWRKRKEVQGA